MLKPKGKTVAAINSTQSGEQEKTKKSRKSNTEFLMSDGVSFYLELPEFKDQTSRCTQRMMNDTILGHMGTA